ncbi:MAG: roadblock/LC7 domain-containing protein [Gammaproteobacteria bacterium]|jgi:predicted regulator of Ras-like GTPase activity (Roadblock/LC7/MglB family)
MMEHANARVKDMTNNADGTKESVTEVTAKFIRPILRELNGKSDEMEASAVISRDGLSLAAVLGDGVDPNRLGAMCAALLGLADTTAKELERGELKQVLLHGAKGVLLLVHIGKTHVLALAAKPNINLGMVLLEAKKTAERLAAII